MIKTGPSTDFGRRKGNHLRQRTALHDEGTADDTGER
jgi:hypothetical protein